MKMLGITTVLFRIQELIFSALVLGAFDGAVEDLCHVTTRSVGLRLIDIRDALTFTNLLSEMKKSRMSLQLVLRLSPYCGGRQSNEVSH